MEGSIFVQILSDLKREGLTAQAENLEAKMRARANHWKAEAYPFGSEMPWDSTGQEEVYAWMKYFGYQDKADVTLNAVLGYDPAIPHWGTTEARAAIGILFLPPSTLASSGSFIITVR